MDLERSLAYAALEAHPHNAAQVLEGLPPEAAVEVLGRAAPETAAKVLRFGAPHFALAVLAGLSGPQAARVLERTPVEVTAGLLRRLPEPECDELIAQLPEARARLVRSLLRYPPGCAASLMDPRAMALPEDVLVEDALKRLRREAEHVLFNLYVLDRNDVLLGVLNLREVLAARPKDRLGAVMRTPVQSIPAAASGRAVLEHPSWQSFCSLPVVDEKGVFLGAIRHRAFRELESAIRLAERDPRTPTIQAIGDLLAIGMGGVVEAMSAAAATRRQPSQGAEER